MNYGEQQQVYLLGHGGLMATPEEALQVCREKMFVVGVTASVDTKCSLFSPVVLLPSGRRSLCLLLILLLCPPL